MSSFTPQYPMTDNKKKRISCSSNKQRPRRRRSADKVVLLVGAQASSHAGGPLGAIRLAHRVEKIPDTIAHRHFFDQVVAVPAEDGRLHHHLFLVLFFDLLIEEEVETKECPFFLSFKFAL